MSAIVIARIGLKCTHAEHAPHEVPPPRHPPFSSKECHKSTADPNGATKRRRCPGRNLNLKLVNACFPCPNVSPALALLVTTQGQSRTTRAEMFPERTLYSDKSRLLCPNRNQRRLNRERREAQSDSPLGSRYPRSWSQSTSRAVQSKLLPTACN